MPLYPGSVADKLKTLLSSWSLYQRRATACHTPLQ